MTFESHIDEAAKKQKKHARIAIEMVLGGLFGGGGMILLSKVIPVAMLDLWEFIALALAALIAMVLTIALATAASRRLMVIRVFDGEADAEEISAQRRIIAYSALSLGAMIPMLYVLALPETVSRDWGMAIIIISLLVLTGAGWAIWRKQDELHRMVALEGANAGLGVIFIGLILWAALDRLGYGIPLQPLPAVILMILVTVISSLVVAARRSMFSA